MMQFYRRFRKLRKKKKLHRQRFRCCFFTDIKN